MELRNNKKKNKKKIDMGISYNVKCSIDMCYIRDTGWDYLKFHLQHERILETTWDIDYS